MKRLFGKLLRKIGPSNKIPTNSDDFLLMLKRGGAKIGDNVTVFSPQKANIDLKNPFLLSIGDNTVITKGVTILMHDYSKHVIRMVTGENIGGKLPVSIGKNCFIGNNATILMGTDIGDNCIIGASAVVKGIIPDNSVVAGNPGRIICTLDEYIKKRRERALDEACEVARAIVRNTNKQPTLKQMGNGFAWLYMPRTPKTIDENPWMFRLSSDKEESVIQSFMDSNPIFKDFDSFLKYALDDEV